MRLDNKNISDLEYLADIGFEQAASIEKEMDELRLMVKSRSFSYNSGKYFVFINIITGVFFGITFFFAVYSSPLSQSSFSKTITKSKSAERPNGMRVIALDTISIVKENFVKEESKQTKLSDTLNSIIEKTDEGADSILMISSQPFNLVQLKNEKVNDPALKFIPNSPVIFIHDLKITDYSFLYFKQNKFITVNGSYGLNASYANKEDFDRYGNVLEPPQNFYLHEAIAEAMLFFKNKNYNGCINSLNTVAQFTGNDINCRFYFGMCYFYKRNYTSALKDFDACIYNLNNTFVQEAEYYKALCLFELGNKTEALNLFRKISGEEGFYAEKAKQYL